jgi:PIN domain nuclease of toxin-antitoxin system
MSLLLDTHVVLWWLTHDPALPDDIKARLDQTLASTSVPQQRIRGPAHQL